MCVNFLPSVNDLLNVIFRVQELNNISRTEDYLSFKISFVVTLLSFANIYENIMCVVRPSRPWS